MHNEMQAAVLPPAVVSKVNEIMDSQKPINIQVDEICQVFLAHGFARRQVVKPPQMLTHPENRGKTMLNVHDCWQKGMQMLQVSMKRALLGEVFVLSFPPTVPLEKPKWTRMSIW